VTRRGTVRVDGGRIAYTEHGEGDQPLVLIHGLMLSQRMHRANATVLAERGHRVITVDLLGHGLASRPRDMTLYSMRQFADQLVALLDALGIEEAIVGGTSLGANVTLEMAVRHPERVLAMVVEMPVLDNALPAAAWTFVPLMTLFTLGAPVARGISRAARLIPSRLVPEWIDIALDVVRSDPGPNGALLQGLLYGEVAPHRDQRRRLNAPALVIGHRRDPLHPFGDSDTLVRELPSGTLVQASSILELRLRPQRLLGVIDAFLTEQWEAAGHPVGRPARSARAS